MLISDEISLIIEKISKSDDAITEFDIAKINHFAREIDQDYAEICNEIIPNSALYLTKSTTEMLVRADISDDEAAAEVLMQKESFLKFKDLAPDLLTYYHFEDRTQIIYAINIIDECRDDYLALSKSHRRDRARREALSTIKLSRGKNARCSTRIKIGRAVFIA